MAWHLKQKINIKYLMVAYLGVWLVVSSLYVRHPTRLLAGVLIVLVYSALDLAWTRLQHRVWYLPVSSWISALILALVGLANLSVLQLVLLPFLAVASKHLLRLGKARHIWNPAAFALGLLGLFTPATSWWAVSWGPLPLIVVLLAGCLILWRLGRWQIAAAFFMGYAVLPALIYLGGGGQFWAALNMFSALLFDGTALFFVTVMLIEPVTSSFPKRLQRWAYGFLVGGLATAISALVPALGGVSLDPLITGLLLGNLAAGLLFLPSRPAAVV